MDDRQLIKQCGGAIRKREQRAFHEGIMPDLKHMIPINAAPEKVYAAVATQAGMRGWWTADTQMDEKIGGKAEFGFDRREAVFRMTIDRLVPSNTVVMSCQGDEPEWAGTTLDWTIEPAPEGALLRFTHRGWREPTDFCASCNSMWGNLMFRLKAFAETSAPSPQWTA
jgi:uncharacterized protein YndB with AHSA1/START domain